VLCARTPSGKSRTPAPIAFVRALKGLILFSIIVNRQRGAAPTLDCSQKRAYASHVLPAVDPESRSTLIHPAHTESVRATIAAPPRPSAWTGQRRALRRIRRCASCDKACRAPEQKSLPPPATQECVGHIAGADWP